MPIEFRCTQCQNILRVGDQHAGGQARCPKCKAVQQIPMQSQTDSDSMPSQSAFPSLDDNQSSPQETPKSLFPESTPQTSGSEKPLSPLGQSPNPFEDSGPQKPNPFPNTPQQQHNPFADTPTPNPYSSSASAASARNRGYSTADAKSRVMGPAISMMILAILVALVLGLGMFAGMVKVLDEGLEDDDVPVFVMLFIMLAINFVIIVGSFRMMQLKNYGLAMTATIISLLCGLGSCIQLGLAIWALVILSDSNVRDKFT